MSPLMCGDCVVDLEPKSWRMNSRESTENFDTFSTNQVNRDFLLSFSISQLSDGLKSNILGMIVDRTKLYDT